MSNESEHRRWNDAYWTSIWPRRERLTSQVTAELIDRLDPRDGESVFDIGSGGGVATFAVADRVGSGAVVGVDISEALIGLARRRADERGASNVSFVLADAQHDPVPGGPFDAAVSQFGVMFFDEPVRAFATIRDQVKSGGRLALACWQAASRNPWNAGPILTRFSPPPAVAPGKSPSGPFTLADPGHTRSLLDQAGWGDIEHFEYERMVTFDRDVVFDEDELAFRKVAEADRSAAVEAVDAQLQTLATPDGRFRAPLAYQVFTARR